MLVDLITWVLALAQSVVAGYLGFFIEATGDKVAGTLIGGAAFGGIVFFCRQTPKKIWWVILRRFTYTYNISYRQDISGGGYSARGNGNGILGSIVENNIQKTITDKRNTANIIVQNSRIATTMSDGSAYLKFMGVWMMVTRSTEKPKEGGDQTPDPIVNLYLRILKHNRGSLLEKIGHLVPDLARPSVYTLSQANDIQRIRGFNNSEIVTLNSDVKKRLDDAIDKFALDYQKNPDAKLSIITYGVPGTGKSSIAEYVALRLKTSLFVLVQPTQHNYRGTSANLTEYISGIRNTVPIGTPAVLLADDFDTLWDGLESRKWLDAEEAKEEAKALEKGQTYNKRNNVINPKGRKNLFDLLNSLQSPAAYTGAVVILNTNMLEKLDEAIYRPSRIHLLLEIGELYPETIHQHYEQVFGKPWPVGLVSRKWRGCDLSTFSRNKTAAEFVKLATSEETVRADYEVLNPADFIPTVQAVVEQIVQQPVQIPDTPVVVTSPTTTTTEELVEA